MNNFFTSILLIINLLILASCSKNDQHHSISKTDGGIESIHNKNRPYKPDMSVNYQQLFEIDLKSSSDDNLGYEMANAAVIRTDSKSNIYILDSKKKRINKFNDKGEFQKSFVNQGTGPGEVQFTWNMTILNDTIIIDDPASHRLLRFNSDGEFVDFIKLNSIFPERFSTLKNSTAVGFASQELFEDEKMYSCYNLAIFNNKFEAEKNIIEIKNLVDDNFNFLDCQLTSYCTGNNKIYVADNNASNYRITVFNADGIPVQVISKAYSRIEFNDEEWKQFQQKNKNRMLFINNKSTYKKSINKMEVDHYGNLWVFPSIMRNESNKNSLIADIFDKNGFFCKRIDLNFLKCNNAAAYKKLHFLDDKILYVDYESQKIKAYSYSF